MSEYTPTEQDRPERDEAGRFVNYAGPGRPRRATEAAYLRILADAVTLNDWRELCANTLQLAKAGDRAARDFIARHLLGVTPPTLMSLALHEMAGISDDDMVAGELELQTDQAMEFYGDKDALQTIIAKRAEERREAAQREAQERAEAERERKRAEREARKAALATDQAAQP